MCGTSKSGRISLRDIGCWMTTLRVLRGLRARAVDRGDEEARQRRELPQERLAIEAATARARDPRNEPLPVPEREHVHERNEHRRIHPGDVAAHEKHRMPLVALLRDEVGMPAAARVRRMLTMSISHERDQASTPNSESGVPLSNVTAG